MHAPDQPVTNPIELAALLPPSGAITTCACCAVLTFLDGSNDGERRAALTP